MSRPVSFKQFGINDRSLYRQYLDVYRAEEQLEQDEFHVFGRDLTRCWKDSRGGVAGGSLGGGRGRVGAIQRAVSWRPASGDGDVDGQARTVRSIDDLGSQPRGVPVGGCSGSDAEGGGSGSGCSDVPGGGSRCVGGAQSDGVGGEDRSVGVAEGDCVSGTESTSLSDGAATGASVVKRGKNYEKNKAKRERAKALRDAGNVPGRGKSLVSVRAAHPQLDETWAERKVRENKVAIAKLDAQLEKIEKEKRDGTAEKRYQVEANLVQGQLDGAFALVPQQRVVSWAKTINSDSSGSKSSGKKTVASIPSLSSGLGSASATSVTAKERQLTEEVAKLRKQLAASDADCKKKIEKVEEVELKKRMDLSNGIERRLMFLEDEVRRRDKLVATYKSIAGIRG